MPARRSHRFGLEQQVDLNNLETAITDFAQSCNKKVKLVLIGFEMAAEWEYLFSLFPRAMPLFSAWVDLRDIANDIASSVGVIPGLGPLLQHFGYHWKDIKPGRGKLGHGGTADNAGDDAVATCALAHALLSKENQGKLRLRQECCQIAGKVTKKKRPKGYLVPNKRDPFTVTIHARGELPTMIDAVIKLARCFCQYSPKAIGIMSKDTAFATFISQDQMDHFIACIHGPPLPTGELLSVQHYSHGNKATERENRENKEKKEWGERKRLEGTGGEVEVVGDLFS